MALPWRAWWCWLMLIACWPAVAAELMIVPVYGPTYENMPAVLDVSVVGVSPDAPWHVTLTGGRVEVLDVQGAVRRVFLVPHAGEHQSILRVMISDVGEWEHRIQWLPQEPTALHIEPVVATIGEGTVRVHIRAGRPIPPDQIQVVLGEGRVVAVEEVRDGLDLLVQLDEGAYPRVVGIGARDLRSGDAPAWGEIRLRTRMTIPVRTIPGTLVTVRIGRRTYGPVQADADGLAQLYVTATPEDHSAQINLKDPGGNETARTFSLSVGESTKLISLVDGARVSNRPAPKVWLHRVGEPLGEMVCRSPALGVLPVLPYDAQTSLVVLGYGVVADTWEIRVRCTLPTTSLQTMLSIPLAEGVPQGLRVRVWPEVLSVDFPVADLAVIIENALGERLEASGTVHVTARYGTIVDNHDENTLFRGEYRGLLTPEIGEDTVDVRWFAPAGRGPPSDIMIASGGRPAPGFAKIAVRVMDALRRPLQGVVVTVSVRGSTTKVTSASDGWATASLPVQDDVNAVVVQASAAGVARSALIYPHIVASQGPGQPDLQATIPIRLDPGRAAQVQVTASKSVVEPGPTGRAEIQVHLFDRQGLPARDPAAKLMVTEGDLSASHIDDDGVLHWSWTPAASFRPRLATVTAHSEALDLRDSMEIRVAPRSIRRVIGIFVGVQTNFGRMISPSVSLDAEWLVKLGPRDVTGHVETGRPSFAIRTSLQWYGGNTRVSLPKLGDGLMRMDLLPISAAALYRQAWPRHALWLGVGLSVAPWIGRTTLDGATVARGSGVLTPGLWLVAGYGLRVPGGELALELRGSTLSSPGSSASLHGIVGGLTAGLSYRISY